ncbi:MAG: hypothetical protein ABIA76_00610 [Candidatus Diapherotrites archaeon]
MQRKKKGVLEKWFSEKNAFPEYFFIRTGKMHPHIDKKKAKKLGADFLSWFWAETHKSKNKKKKHVFPLPKHKERIFGALLPKYDLKLIQEQAKFAVKAFAKKISKKKQAEAEKKIMESISEKSLSVNSILREKTIQDLKHMRNAGKDLYYHLKKHGRIYRAVVHETTGKIFFAKGWSQDKEAMTTPLHEAVHILWQEKIIKADVPFAQAADRLYGLEKGILEKDKRIRFPKKKEFDRMPHKAKNGNYDEPLWTHFAGNRLGQWIYLKLPKNKRWKYLYFRCNGKTHKETMKKIKEKTSK